MILASRFGNRQTRSEWGHESDIRFPWAASLSQAGIAVTPSTAFGLPAVSNVIRSAADVIASLPLIVYKDGEVRERAVKSWQWKLLHEAPAPECDAFEFFYDLALSIEATQNAFVQKAKQNGRVFALYVLDPQRVTVRRDKDTGEKLFDIWVTDGRIRRDLTTAEILHVRGFTPTPGGVAGVSLLQMHRDPLGAAIAMQKFEGDYFRNSANSPFVFEIQQGNQAQARELVDSWKSQHSGPGKQWNPTAVWGGTKVVPMPLSMKDAEHVEEKKLSIEDVARIFRWPKRLLELTDDAPPSDLNAWTAEFLKFYLLPRLKRIEAALNADPDLFSGRALFGEFLTAALERADYVTRVRGYKDARQGSWITANEIRAMENLPRVENGDEILITPVGGAPNPTAAQNGAGSEVDAAAAL